MKQKSGPSSKNIDSVAAAEKFFKSSETGIVGMSMVTIGKKFISIVLFKLMMLALLYIMLFYSIK